SMVARMATTSTASNRATWRRRIIKLRPPWGWLTWIDYTASARDHDSDCRVSSRRWANECCEPSRSPSLARPPKLSCCNSSIENQVDYRNGVLECTPQLMVLRIIRVDHPFDLNTGRVELVFLEIRPRGRPAQIAIRPRLAADVDEAIGLRPLRIEGAVAADLGSNSQKPQKASEQNLIDVRQAALARRLLIEVAHRLNV